MKKPTLNLTFGSDPELMLFDLSEKKIVSSLRVLKRTKDDPIVLGNGIKMYADNVLVETSFPPLSMMEDFISYFRNIFTRMQESLGAQYRLLPQASHVYDEAELKDKIKQRDGTEISAWDIGCNPNFDVYKKQINEPLPFKDGLRTGSFHLHIGNKSWKTNPDGKLMRMPSKEQAIKIMDIFVGCASILFDKDPTSPARRQYYGKAGEFRPTDYGCEYRCLSNWALRSPITTQLVFDLTKHAMSHIADDTVQDVLDAIGDELVQDAINNNKPDLATTILKKASLPSQLFARILKESTPNFYKAWGL